MNNIPFASHVHYKDFYVRPSMADPGEGFFKTVSGNYLRGAVVGHGDVDIRSVTRVIKSSGYDGFVTVEFEGIEDCRSGSKIGMANLKRLWNECN
jgi:inosose dehydratase